MTISLIFFAVLWIINFLNNWAYDGNNFMFNFMGGGIVLFLCLTVFNDLSKNIPHVIKAQRKEYEHINEIKNKFATRYFMFMTLSIVIRLGTVFWYLAEKL